MLGYSEKVIAQLKCPKQVFFCISGQLNLIFLTERKRMNYSELEHWPLLQRIACCKQIVTFQCEPREKKKKKAF